MMQRITDKECMGNISMKRNNARILKKEYYEMLPEIGLALYCLLTPIWNDKKLKL
jgi:hypothetical protein